MLDNLAVFVEAEIESVLSCIWQFAASLRFHSSNAACEYLQEFPVYTLTAKDTKTAAAKLLLKDVKVKSSEIHVTLGL